MSFFYAHNLARSDRLHLSPVFLHVFCQRNLASCSHQIMAWIADTVVVVALQVIVQEANGLLHGYSKTAKR